MKLPTSHRLFGRVSYVVGVLLAIWLLTPSAVFGQDMSRYMVFDIPPEKIQKQFGEIPGSMLSYKDRLEIASSRFDADTMKILAILVDWSDRPGSFSPATVDSLLKSRAWGRDERWGELDPRPKPQSTEA